MMPRISPVAPDVVWTTFSPRRKVPVGTPDPMGIFIVEGPSPHHHAPEPAVPWNAAGIVSVIEDFSVHVAVPGVVSAIAAGFSISTEVAEMNLVMSHVPTLAAFVAPVMAKKRPSEASTNPVRPVMTERPPLAVVEGVAMVKDTVAVWAPT
jgi:hypothetical protein